MEHRGGIVHRAKGIDRGTELFLDETPSYTVGKAAAHEKHLFQRLNPNHRLGYFYYSTELQNYEL